MRRRLHYRAQKVVVGGDEEDGARTPSVPKQRRGRAVPVDKRLAAAF